MSDRVGRKPLMVALSLAGVLSAGVVLAIMYLDLSVYYFVLCYFINSLGGGSTGLFFSYLADISSPRWITYRIGFAEGMLVLSIALCTAAGGAWIGSSNCYYPYIAWLMLASYLAVLLYVLVFLPESLAREERQRRHAIAGHRSGLRSVFRVGTVVGLEAIAAPPMRSMLSASVNPSDQVAAIFTPVATKTLNSRGVAFI
eukprot:Em0015g777a